MEPTATTIESDLKGLQQLPTPVASWHVEMGPDATEDPSVWVWVMLEDEDVDIWTRALLREMVRDTVRRRARHAPWVYVRFRGASESIQG